MEMYRFCLVWCPSFRQIRGVRCLAHDRRLYGSLVGDYWLWTHRLHSLEHGREMVSDIPVGSVSDKDERKYSMDTVRITGIIHEEIRTAQTKMTVKILYYLLVSLSACPLLRLSI